MSKPNKTQPTTTSVTDFLNQITDDQKRKDCSIINDIHIKISGCKPVLWSSSIVGYGEYQYQGKSRSGTWMRAAFAPRAANITIYIMQGFKPYNDLLARLGKHKTGKSCLYIRRLSDVDIDVLTQIIAGSWEYMAATYPS